VVGDAGKSGTVDAGTASRLSGTILEDLAGGAGARDPERVAAAKKITEMPSSTISDIDIARGDDRTHIQRGTAPSAVLRASSGSDWIFWTDLIEFRVPPDILTALAARNLRHVALPRRWAMSTWTITRYGSPSCPQSPVVS